MDLYDDLDGPEATQNSAYDLARSVPRASPNEDQAARAQQELGHYKQQNAKLLRKCTMLEKNLSCLYKTAWAHLRRKDEYIEALKTQIKEFRKLTGMVEPGVHLDGNMADASDVTEELSRKRHRLAQDDRPAEGFQCQGQAKRPKDISNIQSQTQNLSECVEPGTLDLKRSTLRGDLRPQPTLQAYRREAEPCALANAKTGRVESIRAERHPPPSNPNSSLLNHGANVASGHGGHPCSDAAHRQRATPASGPPESDHRGMHSRSRDGNHARARWSAQGAFSRSSKVDGCRQRPLDDDHHADFRSAESPRGLRTTAMAGDLRRRNEHDFRTSRMSPRQRG